MFPSLGEERETHTLLGPLGRELTSVSVMNPIEITSLSLSTRDRKQIQRSNGIPNDGQNPYAQRF
jgi:hypothetical protein